MTTRSPTICARLACVNLLARARPGPFSGLLMRSRVRKMGAPHPLLLQPRAAAVPLDATHHAPAGVNVAAFLLGVLS